MNYEELLAARNEGQKHQVMQPIGGFYREQVDGKWRCVVDILPEKNQNIAFSKALQAECEKNATLVDKHQIHFTPLKNNEGDVERLELELGNYQTFEQLLIDNPAIVAEKGFMDEVLSSLIEATTYLHSQQIRHVCYSPKTVFVRKGDNKALLLSHGSFYHALSDLQEFYGDDAQYVAPEVLNGGTVDDRCDVYSIGKFISGLYDKSDLPLEYRSALKKATSESPEDRFNTPEDLLKAIQKRRASFKSLITLLIAAVATLICVGLYFEYFPETQPVEFVKPAPRQPTDDLIDDGFDPAELGVTSDGDSLVVDEAAERDFQAKAEEIFRKRYEKEADRILSKIYNKEYMSNSEKKFLSESESTIEELMKTQSELGADAGLSPERSQLIATEIIERITNQKKQQIGGTNSRGVQLPGKNY
jgi:serine/threonine protein kinase